MNVKNIILALCFLTEMCMAQHYDPVVPEIGNSFEKFDVGIFPTDPEKHIRYEKKDASGKTVYVSIDSNMYQENDSLNFQLKYYVRYNDSDAMTGYDYSVNPIMCTIRGFYKNGNIRQKGLYCVLGFSFGYRYSYDRNGMLIQTENLDDGYAFDYKKLFDFCIKNGIPLNPRNAAGAIETEITKYNGDWYVSYNANTRKIYQLDGNTGELIKFTEMQLMQYGE